MTVRTRRTTGLLVATCATTVVALVLQVRNTAPVQQLPTSAATTRRRGPTPPPATPPARPAGRDLGPRRADASELAVAAPAAEDDAVAHARAIFGAASPRAVFAREPRDPAFAPRREAALEARLAARVQARLGFEPRIRATCHASTCEVLLDGFTTDEDQGLALDAMDLQFLAEGVMVGPITPRDRASPDPPADPVLGFSIYLHYPVAWRDPTTYEEILLRHAHQDSTPDP